LLGTYHVAVIGSDYERSQRFYVEILGLEVVREVFRRDRISYRFDERLIPIVEVNLVRPDGFVDGVLIGEIGTRNHDRSSTTDSMPPLGGWGRLVSWPRTRSCGRSARPTRPRRAASPNR
jgi:catechol 2,3-dioxygenase-like lactoylglutathione lyase family enzyme